MRTIEEIRAERDEARRLYRNSRGNGDARARGRLLRRIEGANWELDRRRAGQPVARVVHGTADHGLTVVGERVSVEMPSQPPELVGYVDPQAGLSVHDAEGGKERMWLVHPAALEAAVDAVAREAAVNPGFRERLKARLRGGADVPALPRAARDAHEAAVFHYSYPGSPA